MSDFYKFNLTKARKVHRCCECFGEIQIGEIYYRHSGTWEGDFYSSKNCDDCEHLRSDLNKELSKEEKITLEMLSESCQESGGFDYIRFLNIKLKRGAKIYQNHLDFMKEWEDENDERSNKES
jgi:hypothetical protein